MLPLRSAIFVLSATVASAAFANAPDAATQTAPVKPHTAPAEHGPHLQGLTATLPLVMVNGFPFVEGSINGKSGKIMFDLGMDQSLVVDSHTIEIPGKIRTGSGYFGSGQTFERFNYPLVSELKLPGGLRYTDMTNIAGNPGIPIEQEIAADFIGWLGVEFFSGYVLKIDYAKSMLTFYRDDANGSGDTAALAGEHVIRAIHIASSKGHKSLMNLPVKVGNTAFLATLDTGSHTVIAVNDDQLAALKKAGTLHQESEDKGTISGLVVDGIALAPMEVEIMHGTVPEKNLLPPTDDPVMTLGYEFLSRYKTVWDYDTETLTLLEK